MAGAVARYVKWFYSTPMGVLNLASITAAPFLGYILIKQEEQFACLDNLEKLQQERINALVDRGLIRVREP